MLTRTTRVLLFPRGRFSSMLEMGGVASANVDTSVDVGKNNKVQAVALDFDLITRAIDKSKLDDGTSNSQPIIQKNGVAISNSVFPDVEKVVRDMAKLLNVKIGGDGSGQKETKRSKDEDDLSLLTGASSSSNNDGNNKTVSTFNPSTIDIRTKYAAKLRSKVEGGLAGVELANTKKEEALKHGDAAGHMVARSIAASQTVSKSGSKWMASTGTGTLCSFLSNRSMKIALVPLPSISSPEERQRMKNSMEQLAKQLPQVKFSVLGLDDSDHTKSENAGEILKYVTAKMEARPISTIVVSDRDDYLGSAKDLGMFTCRVRKANAPRGNVTTSYTVEDIKEVQDVVNDLNGISYNTVFKQ